MSQEESKHVSVNGDSPITVETTQEHASTAHQPSSELKQHSDTAMNDKGHQKQSSLASLAVAEDLPAGEGHTSQPPSPSDSSDFKSPELQNVALEELSLDDSTSKKPGSLSLEHIHVSQVEE